jgi:hypothetical protein
MGKEETEKGEKRKENGDLGIMTKETAVAYIKAVCQYLPSPPPVRA